jgi:hypothetical protein
VEASLTAKYENGRLCGTATSPDGLTYTWIAYRDVTEPSEPRTHDFTPTEFERYSPPRPNPSSASGPAIRSVPGA